MKCTKIEYDKTIIIKTEKIPSVIIYVSTNNINFQINFFHTLYVYTI